MDRKWVLVDSTSGMMMAEMLKSLLEAEGILVMLTQEGAGHAMGLTVGPLGEVQVLVASDQEEAAREIIDMYYQSTGEAGEEE